MINVLIVYKEKRPMQCLKGQVSGNFPKAQVGVIRTDLMSN